MKKLSYDPAKRVKTLKERGLDFEHVAEVFRYGYYTFDDVRKDYGEVRKITVGYLDGRMVIVVWTPRGSSRHIISMRKANVREQKNYQEVTQTFMG